MAKWKELPPSPEAIVRAALEDASGKLLWCAREGRMEKSLINYPTQWAAEFRALTQKDKRDE